MEVIVIFAAIVILVFLITFISGRRFGPLALSLAAGSMLAEIWAEWLTIIVSGLGFEVPGLPYGVISTIIILIGPLCVLLLSGPKYFTKIERLGSALLISVLAAAFLVRPMGQYMTLNGEALAIYTVLVEWWRYVVTAGLILGLIDLFLLHSVKASKSKKS